MVQSQQTFGTGLQLLLFLQAKRKRLFTRHSCHFFCFIYRAYIFDSGGDSTKVFAQQTIEDVGKFFTILLGVDICLNPVYIKVSGQYCISTISKYVVITFAGG